MSDWSGEAYERIAEVGDLIGAWLERHVSNVVKANAARILILALVGLIAAQGLLLLNVPDEDLSWLGLVLKNVGPELAGIVFGVVAIDLLNERRQDEQLKEQLMLQMGSTHNDVTDTAIRALRSRGWLSDGSLSGANLAGANLNGANLAGANLSGVNLAEVDLSNAFLVRANLSRAILEEANLSEANLAGVDLSNAFLVRANLSRAVLEEANLSEANLARANLRGAFLNETRLEGTRVLEADLGGAYLWEADLVGAKDWTVQQLEQVATMEGAIMPDRVQLRQEQYYSGYYFSAHGLMEEESAEDSSYGFHGDFRQFIEGPSFGEWKVQYLAKYGGTVSELRDATMIFLDAARTARAEQPHGGELDDMASGASEGSSPG